MSVHFMETNTFPNSTCHVDLITIKHKSVQKDLSFWNSEIVSATIKSAKIESGYAITVSMLVLNRHRFQIDVSA